MLDHPREHDRTLVRSLNRPDFSRLNSNDRKRRANSRQHAANDAMEVDDKDSPGQLKVEEPAIITTASVGAEKGMQSKSIYEPAVSRTIAMIELPEADVLNLAWVNPAFEGDDQQLLATGGHIWRTYRMSPTTSTATGAEDLQYLDHGRHIVSSSAMDSSGKRLALALDRGDTSKILLMTTSEEKKQDRQVIAKLPGSVLLVRWSVSSELVLCTTQSNAQDSQQENMSSFSVFNVASMSTLEVSAHEEPLEDIAWVDDSRFLACGDGLLRAFGVSSDGVVVQRSIPTTAMWSIIKYDALTNRACCVSPDDGNLALLTIADDDFGFHSKVSQQQGQVTGLEWQPINGEVTQIVLDQSRRRLLATSSTCGKVVIWNAYMNLECIRTLTMQDGLPAMALAFSPDGKYIASSGGDTVCIWTVDEEIEDSDILERNNKPLAVWKATACGNNDSQQLIGWPLEEGPFQVLCWDPSSTKLAYSTGSKVRSLEICPVSGHGTEG